MQRVAAQRAVQRQMPSGDALAARFAPQLQAARSLVADLELEATAAEEERIPTAAAEPPIHHFTSVAGLGHTQLPHCASERICRWPGALSWAARAAAAAEPSQAVAAAAAAAAVPMRSEHSSGGA